MADPAAITQLKAAAEELSAGLSTLLGQNVSASCCGGSKTQPAGTLVVKVTPKLPKLDVGDEGYALGRDGSGNVMLMAGSPAGALYGSFRLLGLLQRGEAVPGTVDKPETSIPAMDLRIWDFWDNLDGTIERGFAGASLIWPMALNKRMHRRWDDASAAKVEQMARLLISCGLNGVVLNNVNACGKNAELLTPESLGSVAKTAYPIFQKWGLKVYIVPCYAAPMSPGMGAPPLKGVDPLDPLVIAWWKNKVDAITELMPAFGGFTVKADSEGNQVRSYRLRAVRSYVYGF